MSNIIEKAIKLFSRQVICDCPMTNEHDPIAGKLFKHYKNGKMYRYLFPAMDKSGSKEELLVVYQEIDSDRRYTRKWNDFFSSTKINGKDVPRFEEQND